MEAATNQVDALAGRPPAAVAAAPEGYRRGVVVGWTRKEWADEKLVRECNAVRAAGPGERNGTLFRAACRVSAYVADGVLEESRAWGELEAAAEACGLERPEVIRTIRSGITRDGAESAWYPAERVERIDGAPPRRGPPTVRLRAVGRDEPVPRPDVGLPVTGCGHEVRVTLYDGLRVTGGLGQVWTWDDLVDAVRSPAPWPDEGKDGLPLWSFAEIEGDDRGRRRLGVDDSGRETTRDPETYRVHALVLDYDDDPRWSLEQVDAWWGGVQYVAHTSASDGVDKDKKPAGPRGRVILALSRPVTPEEYDRIAEWALTCDRGEIGAQEIRSIRRAYFVPSAAPQGYDWSASLTGQGIDVDALFAAIDKAERVAELEPLEGPDPNVDAGLDWSQSGQRKDHNVNLARILDGDPRWVGRIRRNLFTGQVEVDGGPVTDPLEGEIGVWLGDVYGVHPPTGRVHEVVQMIGARHEYHPVREYLDGLVWDGEPRIDRWLVTWGGCEWTPDGLTGAMASKLLIAMVARVYQPGCKVDHVVVLRGAQGTGKSTAMAALVGPRWFSDTALAIGDKDSYQALSGVWLYELSELDAVRRSDWSAVKAFLSAQVDRYRPSYGRNVVQVPRQVVFVGTTNEATFLGDSTGSRRFWVRDVVGAIDVEGIALHRDQLWAEAVHRWRGGERWWLEESDEAARQVDAERYQIEDPWEHAVAGYLLGRESVTTTEILEHLEIAQGDHTKAHEMRLTAILARLGRVRRRVREGTGRPYRWVREE